MPAAFSHNVTLTGTSLTGLSPAPIEWTPSASPTGGVTFLAIEGSAVGSKEAIGRARRVDAKRAGPLGGGLARHIPRHRARPRYCRRSHTSGKEKRAGASCGCVVDGLAGAGPAHRYRWV